MSSFIEIRNVSMNFGDVVAVDDVSLSVRQGEVFGLVGSDGAGKSTLLRMLATMVIPSKGDISIHGFNVVSD